jgi:outer membrane protein
VITVHAENPMNQRTAIHLCLTTTLIALLALAATTQPIAAQEKAPTSAQQDTAAKIPGATTAPGRDYSQGQGWFPLTLKPFRQQPIPAPRMANAPALAGLIENGTMQLSLDKLLDAVIANNLTIDGVRYTLSIADTDLLKARAGSNPTGTEAASIPAALGSVSFGAGGTGNANTTARTINVSPRGSFDPSLSLTFGVDNTTSPQATTRVTGVPSVTTHTNTLQSRFTQAFSTGTSFSFNFNVGRQSSTSRNQRFNPSFTSNYNLSVNQQLFSGFGPTMNRRFIKVADTNRQTTRQYFAMQVITAVVSAENAYWDLVAAQEKVRTAEQALTVSEQLLSDNRKQAEIGTLAPLDVLTSESEAAGRRRDLIVAQTGAQLASLKLKNMMARQMDEPLAAASVQTTDALPDPKDADLPSFDAALAAAMGKRPEMAQAEGNIHVQDVAVAYTRKKLQPSFSIFGVLSSQGRQSDLTGAWSQVGNINFPEYAYGFLFSFPIGNRAAQADHQQALLVRQQSETSLQRTRDTIRMEVRNAIIGLVQAKSQVEAAHMAVALSQQTLDAEQKKLRAGTSTSYNVIRVQRDLFNAELAEVQARVGYAKALVEMDRSTGAILDKRLISLDQIIAAR